MILAAVNQVSFPKTSKYNKNLINIALQAQSALTTAEAQRAANQAAATNEAETTALNSLQNLQETEAQPLITTLKTPAGQTAANAAQLAVIFANGAAFNNQAKAAAAVRLPFY